MSNRTDDRDWCPMRLSGTMRCEGPDPALKAENEKLRKLVRDMHMVMVADAANCDVTYPEQFEQRMRELGIEVDE